MITSYFRTFFFTVFFLVGVASVANYIINPLGIYGTPVIKGLNDRYPTVPYFLRIHKTERIKQLKPDTVIIGSSRALVGLNPRPEFFEDGAVVYNAGLTAARIYEQRCLLEFAAAATQLRLVILTLDFFAFSAGDPEDEQFEPERCSPLSLSPVRSFLNRYDSLVSLDTIIASVKHLHYIRRPVAHFSFIQPNGYMQNNSFYYRAALNGFAPYFQNPPVATKKGFTFVYPEKSKGTAFRYVEDMLDLARKKGIDVIILFSPAHESFIAGLEREGMWPLVTEWKKQVEDIVFSNAQQYGEEPYPLWDFFYRDPFTAETVPVDGDRETRMHRFVDSGHYTPEAGDILLKKILGLYKRGEDPWPRFGRLLNTTEK